MSTTKQKKVARKVAENFELDEPLTGGEIVESSGYGVSMKKNPQVILNSEGVREELRKLGFDSDNARRVIAEILNDETIEPRDRIKAAENVFKVQGDYAPEKHINLNIKQSPSKRIQSLADELLVLQSGNEKRREDVSRAEKQSK